MQLGDLLRNPYDLQRSISCIPLAIERGEERIMLPADNEPLFECDEILLCGTEHSETILSATLNNEYTLHYLISGMDPPRGYFFQWLSSRRGTASALN